MLSEKAKEVFEKLSLPYPAVAVKLCYSKPENAEHVDEKLAFCQFLKKAQTEQRKFYITKEDDECFGKMVLGMVDKPAFGASGQVGYDFGVFKSPAPNARLYNLIPTLVRGAHNYVVYCPVSLCDFDPDLLIAVANTSQADIILRATSYISGDLWESKTSPVLSCAWMYAYPYISGKVNFCTTGMYHGMKRRKVYPEGLHIISIPYQKIDEVVKALSEMDWVLPAMSEDEETKAMLAKKMEAWNLMEKDIQL